MNSLQAVLNTRKFLIRAIANPEMPEELRKEIFLLLKHYPSEVDLDITVEALPSIWEEVN
jgi:hypothetical protein